MTKKFKEEVDPKTGFAIIPKNAIVEKIVIEIPLSGLDIAVKHIEEIPIKGLDIAKVEKIEIPLKKKSYKVHKNDASKKA